AADVSLQARGQSVRLSPGRIIRHVGLAAPCLVHFVRARHLSPTILLVRVAVHNPSPITHRKATLRYRILWTLGAQKRFAAQLVPWLKEPARHLERFSRPWYGFGVGSLLAGSRAIASSQLHKESYNGCRCRKRLRRTSLISGASPER